MQTLVGTNVEMVTDSVEQLLKHHMPFVMMVTQWVVMAVVVCALWKMIALVLEVVLGVLMCAQRFVEMDLIWVYFLVMIRILFQGMDAVICVQWSWVIHVEKVIMLMQAFVKRSVETEGMLESSNVMMATFIMVMDVIQTVTWNMGTVVLEEHSIVLILAKRCVEMGSTCTLILMNVMTITLFQEMDAVVVVLWKWVGHVLEGQLQHKMCVQRFNWMVVISTDTGVMMAIITREMAVISPAMSNQDGLVPEVIVRVQTIVGNLIPE